MSKRRAFVGATIINGDKTKPVIRDGLILVNEDGILEYVGNRKEIPAGTETVDVTGKFIMPGLINAHVHHFNMGGPRNNMAGTEAEVLLFLMRSWLGNLAMRPIYKMNAKTFVNAGVTTVRDMGSFFNLDLKIKKKINAGKMEGPRVLTSGALIIPTGGHGFKMPGSIICDGRTECMRATRYNYSLGVDWIKICNTGGVTDARFVGEAGMPHFSVEEIEAVCQEAHRRNIMVASHCESTQGMRDCLAAGVDTIEHAGTIEDDMIDLFLHNPKTLRGYVSIVPTLAAANAIHQHKDQMIPSPGNDIIIENSRLTAEGSYNALRTAVKYGIKVGIGTDASVPYVPPYNTYKELILFQECTGLGNLEIIDIATRETAEVIAADSYTGTLDAGKAADFIILKADPLESLNNLKRPEGVVAAGRYYDKPAYKEINGVDD